MSPKLVPDDPEKCMVISPLDSDPNIVTLSLPFSRFGRIKIGGRATLIRFPTFSTEDQGASSVSATSPANREDAKTPISATAGATPTTTPSTFSPNASGQTTASPITTSSTAAPTPSTSAQPIATPATPSSSKPSVAVFSPVALTPQVKAQIAQMGELRYIAALDMEHHIFVKDWSDAYPNATIIGPEGMRAKKEALRNRKWVEFLEKERRSRHTPVSASENGVENDAQGEEQDTKTAVNGGAARAEPSPKTASGTGQSQEGQSEASNGTVTEKEDYSISPELDSLFRSTFIPAHPNKELVFLHQPSKTLITADLLFNLPATQQYALSSESATSGLFTRLFTSLNGTGEGQIKWQSRFLWYLISAQDRVGFARSVSEVDGWGIKNLVMCHGDTVEGRGGDVFRRLFGWHLDLAKRQS
ncbi:MAG: hypothetical protein Q9162_000005 [Coniocarpon cinnabarinum]